MCHDPRNPVRDPLVPARGGAPAQGSTGSPSERRYELDPCVAPGDGLAPAGARSRITSAWPAPDVGVASGGCRESKRVVRGIYSRETYFSPGPARAYRPAVSKLVRPSSGEP